MLSTVLKPFKGATVFMSGQKYATISVVLAPVLYNDNEVQPKTLLVVINCKDRVFLNSRNKHLLV